jgi:hypothetical protein
MAVSNCIPLSGHHARPTVPTCSSTLCVAKDMPPIQLPENLLTSCIPLVTTHCHTRLSKCFLNPLSSALGHTPIPSLQDYGKWPDPSTYLHSLKATPLHTCHTPHWAVNVSKAGLYMLQVCASWSLGKAGLLMLLESGNEEVTANHMNALCQSGSRISGMAEWLKS